MNNSKGFTLIELVIVIVILGILAATAAPKFIDLTGDARAAVMEGVEGSVNSAADIAHAKALIEGKTGAAAPDQFITLGEGTSATQILLNHGWPTNASIHLVIDISDEAIEETTVSGEFAHSEAPEYSTTPLDCSVTYVNTVTDAETRPTIDSTLTGC